MTIPEIHMYVEHTFPAVAPDEDEVELEDVVEVVVEFVVLELSSPSSPWSPSLSSRPCARRRQTLSSCIEGEVEEHGGGLHGHAARMRQ